MEKKYLYKDNTTEESFLKYRDRKRPLVSYSEEDEIIYTPKVPEVGDIVYFSNEEQKLKRIEVKDYKPELGKAIGIVVIPGSHRPNGKPVIMGGIEYTKEQLETYEWLKNLDYSNEEIKQDLSEVIYNEYFCRFLNYYELTYGNLDYSIIVSPNFNSIKNTYKSPNEEYYDKYPLLKNLELTEEQFNFGKFYYNKLIPDIDDDFQYNPVTQTYETFYYNITDFNTPIKSNNYYTLTIIPSDTSSNRIKLEYYTLLKYYNTQINPINQGGYDPNELDRFVENVFLPLNETNLTPYTKNSYYYYNLRYNTCWLSPFNEDFSYNENFVKEGTVFADGDGKEKTKILSDVFPGNQRISAVLNYETLGTNKGDWFIPSVAELSYFATNKLLLLRSIHKINWMTFYGDLRNGYGINLITSNFYNEYTSDDINDFKLYTIYESRLNIDYYNIIFFSKLIPFCEVDI